MSLLMAKIQPDTTVTLTCPVQSTPSDCHRKKPAGHRSYLDMSSMINTEHRFTIKTPCECLRQKNSWKLQLHRHVRYGKHSVTVYGNNQPDSTMQAPTVTTKCQHILTYNDMCLLEKPHNCQPESKYLTSKTANSPANKKHITSLPNNT